MNYRHLTLEQRYQIAALHGAGESRKSIAEKIGRHPSTVGRELSRNRCGTAYTASQAHGRATQRRTLASSRSPLAPGVVAQRLAPLHVIPVASSAYLQGRQLPQKPDELERLDGVSMRSPQTGRLRVWRMRNRDGGEATLEHRARVVADDPEAICLAALMGLGVAMIAVPYVERHLESGALQRLLPGWYADLGSISIYYTGRKLLPSKIRVFVDHVTTAFREQNLARRFSADG